MLENIYVKCGLKFFNFQNFNNALTNIMWNSDRHAWLGGRQMLLGGTDAWFQLVATHLKFWLNNRVFHFQGQGDREGEGVKELRATVTCAVHEKLSPNLKVLAFAQLGALSHFTGSPTFINCTTRCNVSARAGAGGNGWGSEAALHPNPSCNSVQLCDLSTFSNFFDWQLLWL